MMQLQGEIGESTLRVGDFIITLSEMDIQAGRKSVKNIKLNLTISPVTWI